MRQVQRQKTNPKPCRILMKHIGWPPEYRSFECWKFVWDRLKSIPKLQPGKVKSQEACLFKKVCFFGTIQYHSLNSKVCLSRYRALLKGLMMKSVKCYYGGYRKKSIFVHQYLRYSDTCDEQLPEMSLKSSRSEEVVSCRGYICLYQIEQLPHEGGLPSQVGLLSSGSLDAGFHCSIL